MSVTDILNLKGTDIFCVNCDNDIEMISQKLAAKSIGVMVVKEDEKLAGIISERDVVRAIAAHGAKAMSMRAKEIMTKEVVTCNPEDTIGALMSLMTMNRIRHLPVVQNDDLVGLISIGDVVKARIAEAEFEADQMKQYIASGG